jgi:DNA invertase Pin-like site-specific DNA recombinase
MLAEVRVDLIRANTRDGLEAARARGRSGGRKPKLTPAQAEQARRIWAAREMSLRQIGELFGVAPSTVYGYVKDAERVTNTTEETEQ